MEPMGVGGFPGTHCLASTRHSWGFMSFRPSHAPFLPPHPRQWDVAIFVTPRCLLSNTTQMGTRINMKERFNAPWWPAAILVSNGSNCSSDWYFGFCCVCVGGYFLKRVKSETNMKTRLLPMSGTRANCEASDVFFPHTRSRWKRALAPSLTTSNTDAVVLPS